MLLYRLFTPPKWSDSQDDCFRAKLNRVSFNDIKKLASHAQELGNGVVIDNVIVSFTDMLRGAAFGPGNRPRKKTKKKKDKPWFDYDCKNKLKFIRLLCKSLKSRPWDGNLRGKVMYERKSLKFIIRKKYRLYRKKILDRLMFDDNQTSSSFWNLMNKIKNEKRGRCEYEYFSKGMGRIFY